MANTTSNTDRINNGFKLLLPVIATAVTDALREKYGDDWWNRAVLQKLDYVQRKDLPTSGADDELIKSLDIARAFRLLTSIHWKDVFEPRCTDDSAQGFSWDCRSWCFDLIEYRNQTAHIGQDDISDREARRCIDTMVRLCERFNVAVSKQILEIYDDIGSGSHPEPDRQKPLGSGGGVVPSSAETVREDTGDHDLCSIDSMDLVDAFEGYIVRKDLTKRIKSGANVPVFVLEYLLGIYCSSNSEEEIRDGMRAVKDKLARLYIRPDEAELVKSRIREAGEGYSVIDKVSVSLDYKHDIYLASFVSLGLRDVPIERDMVVGNQRLLSGGIWCIITFDYSYIGDEKVLNPFKITRLSPIQMPFVDAEDFISKRQYFTKDQWIALMLRSTGIEPESMDYRSRMLLLARMMALVENNMNICELGPRSTGKSHLFKEISPSSILVSGGQASVASLFYNLSTHTPGLVCNWDVVAFDEVAEIRFRDKDAITIMKDYMASGSFSRGGEFMEGKASMVFVGNMNMDINTLLLQSSLFKPFPAGMNEDTAFLDRMHCYIPGWEIEPFSPKTFTDDYGLICDYFSEISRELRKYQFSEAFEEYFELDRSLKQRDVTAIRKIVSAMMKLIYPDGKVDKEGVREILEFAMEMRSRVKEQLKRIQPDDEFSDARFIYHDNGTGESREVLVPECENLRSRQGEELF